MMIRARGSRLHRLAFDALSFVGRPFGGVRPRRMYHWLAERAFASPEFRWYRNRWAAELHLSPYYFIDRSIIAFGSYEDDLHRFIEAEVRPGMVCLDVGANLGEIALHLARRTGPEGRVLAFEPIPPVLARLERHVERNALEGVIEVLPIALSDRVGRVTMSYADPEETNQGMASILARDFEKTALRVEVPTQTLDALVAQRGLERIDLIKLDVQGAEPLVLAGAADTLRRLAPDLLLEVSPLDLRDMGCDSRTLCLDVESFGYALYEIQSGRIARRLHADRIAPDFESAAIYATRRPR